MSFLWAGQQDTLCSTKQGQQMVSPFSHFFLFCFVCLFKKSSIKCFTKQNILSAKTACLISLLQWPSYRNYSHSKGLFPRSNISNENISKIRWKVFEGSRAKIIKRVKEQERQGNGDESPCIQEKWCNAYFYEWLFSGFVINSFMSYLFLIILFGCWDICACKPLETKILCMIYKRSSSYSEGSHITVQLLSLTLT